MPNMSGRLTEEEIWALVAFLQSQGGEVTVRPGDLSDDGGGEGGAGDGTEEGP